MGLFTGVACLFLLFLRERTFTAATLPTPSLLLSPEKIPLPETSPAPHDPPGALPIVETNPIADVSAIKIFSAQAVAGVSSAYDFSLYLPDGWRAEAIRANESINIYDPASSGDVTLEKSQIFIRYFRASNFQTLQSMQIRSKVETSVASLAAMDYIVQKKAGYADFRSQPSWRSNAEHRVVDVRTSAENPAVFLVFARRPDLPDDIFKAILETVVIAPQGLVFYPSDYFVDGVTKKPFGIFITPTSSPVFPERFSGYHNAVDVEIPLGVSPTATIAVYAIADGVVAYSARAKGYGGVAAIRHTIGGVSYLAIYGHLNPALLPRLGANVRAGAVIGYLGRGFTSQTDGERRHLHFGLYTGSDVNIAGYVQSQEELARWVDPAAFFAEQFK